MQRDTSRSSWPARCWAQRLSVGLFCALLWLAAPRSANGQIENPSEPPSLTVSLEQAEQTLTLLVQRLVERQQQVSDLRTNLRTADASLIDLAESLTILRGQLEAAQESLSKSQADLTATSSSLGSLSTRYDALDRSWQSYRSEMKGQVRGLEFSARLWRGVAITAGGIVLLELSYLAGHVLGWW